MNERVRELVKQAYINDASKNPNWRFKPETGHLLKQLEGFTDELVRLIVLECAEVDDEHVDLWGKTVAQEIRDHFGVSNEQPGEL